MHVGMSLSLLVQRVLTQCRTLATLLSFHGGHATDARAPSKGEGASSSRACASSSHNADPAQEEEQVAEEE